jgi:spermidine/putrescine-binding protein
MKKLLIISTAFLVAFSTFAIIALSTPSSILYLLNWGEYMDKSLIEEFEKEYNCQVVEEDVTSSEAMYQKITSKTTSYDVAIPGDYMVHQLYDEGYLRELDVKNKEYENLNSYQTIFNDGLSSLMETYMKDSNGKEFNSYFMPYFWGAYSMIYSTKNPEVKTVLSENGFKALWDRSLFTSQVHIGMYDTARWIVSSYLLSKGLDPNITSYDGSKEGDLSEEIQKDCIQTIKNVNFDEFGNDSLKRNVANGSLDYCYTQLGDFFDTLYLVYSQSSGTPEINFDILVPKTTAAFFDSMVIPTTTQNYDLANKFINFMLDTDHAYQNAKEIGYSPTLKSVQEKFNTDAEAGELYYEGDEDSQSVTLKDFLSRYPYYLNPLYNTEKVYMLEPKSTQYLTTCETIFNNLA